MELNESRGQHSGRGVEGLLTGERSISSCAKALERTNSFRIGGQAPEFYEPRTSAEFRSVVSSCRDRNPFVLGGGCNTLFPDAAFERPVVSTAKLRGIDIDGDRVHADCGVRIGTLIGKTIEAGLGGLELFVGIPGTIGGAIAMNAGGGGRSFGDYVETLRLIRLEDGEELQFDGSDVPWSYRSWNMDGYAVLSVTFRLQPMPAEELREQARDLFYLKKRSQPLTEPSAGCIFKNPPGHAAAQLIDELGLKGLRCGGAQVSETHANFIVNNAGASAAEVRELIRQIQDRVEHAYGVRLETEVVLADGVPI